MAKSILRNTETLTVVKVYGVSGTTVETFALATDIASGTQVAAGPYKVWLNHLQWSLQGDNGASKIAITRGGMPVITLWDNGEVFDFAGNGGFAETTGEASDIVVTITGNAFLYMTLRKVAGYNSKVETEKFGPYDNTTVVGS